jgi:DDE family transposase
VAYHVSDTKLGDNEGVAPLVEQAEANLGAGRIETLAYDKAADSEEVHETLSGKGIKPLIQIRALWEVDPERMLPGHDGSSNVVYDEAGTIYCYDKVSDPPIRHPMSYIGYEPERETLKYRCPAKHEGWECPMATICNAGKSYGKTVRVPREVDLRRFPALPRATKKFEQMYKGRTAVERVNARLKIFWGADDGNVTGSRRFVAGVGVVLAVHAAFATLLASAPRREGTLGKVRLSPIAEALRGEAKPEAVAV